MSSSTNKSVASSSPPIRSTKSKNSKSSSPWNKFFSKLGGGGKKKPKVASAVEEKEDNPGTAQNKQQPKPGRRDGSSQKSVGSLEELTARTSQNSQDFLLSSSKRDSKVGLVARAYTASSSGSLLQPPPAVAAAAAATLYEQPQTPMRSTTTTMTSKPSSAAFSTPSSSWFFGLSWFFGTQYFGTMCDEVFAAMDANHSGTIDEHELYTGLLLLHLKLGMYCGPAACKPLSKPQALALLHTLDTNHDGTMDKHEFRTVLPVLLGNMMTRIGLQVLCTVCLVPFLAHYVVYHLQTTVYHHWYQHIIREQYIQSITFQEQYLPVFKLIVGWDLITHYGTTVLTTFRESTQSVTTIIAVLDFVGNWTQAGIAQYHTMVATISDETWAAFPVTVMTTLFTLLLVPWMLGHTDTLFQCIATKLGSVSSHNSK